MTEGYSLFASVPPQRAEKWHESDRNKNYRAKNCTNADFPFIASVIFKIVIEYLEKLFAETVHIL